MKKSALLAALIVALLLVLAGILIFSRSTGARRTLEPSAILPASTIMLLEIPDPEASGERWKSTALAKIGAEPGMKEFLDRPLSRVQLPGQLSGALPGIWNLKPKRLFAALLSAEGTRPRWIGGFEFEGGKAGVEEAIKDAKAAVLRQHPAGKADLIRHGAIPIETFADGDFQLCSAAHNNTYFIAADVEDLKSVLDRWEKRNSGPQIPVLTDNPAWKEALERLPKSSETRAFLQPAALVDRFSPLLAASGGNFDERQIETMRQIRAIAATTTFDGANLRDTIFIAQPPDIPSPGAPNAPAGLEQPLRAYATASTLFLMSGLTEWPDAIQIPDQADDPVGILEWLRRTLPRLAAQGLGLDKLDDAFGPESGILIDWPQSEFQPSLLASIEVRDHALATRFCDALLANPAAGLAVQTERTGNITYYVFSTGGRVRLTPAIALTPERLLFSHDSARVKAIAPLPAPLPGSGSLEQSAPFKEALGRAGNPDRGFAYLDLKRLFERVYGFARPFLAMSAGLMPDVAHYIDPSKLPATETVGQHLGPVVFSHRTVPGGVLIESSGPVTLNQIVFAGVVGAGVSAMRGYLEP